jgi:hypothetical protein
MKDGREMRTKQDYKATADLGEACVSDVCSSFGVKAI